MYRLLRTVPGNHLKKCVDGWTFHEKEPVSDDLFDRICEGIERSEFTPRGMKKFYLDNKE